MRYRLIWGCVVLSFLFVSCKAQAVTTEVVTASTDTPAPSATILPPTSVSPTLPPSTSTTIPTATKERTQTPTKVQVTSSATQSPATKPAEESVKATSTPAKKISKLDVLSNQLEITYISSGGEISNDTIEGLFLTGSILDEDQMDYFNEQMTLDGFFPGGKTIDLNNTFAFVDLFDDGTWDWALSVLNGESGICFEAGELWIINNNGRIFRLNPDPDWGEWGAPMVMGKSDLTGDGKPDLVIQSLGCLIHTGFGLYHVLSAHSGKVENIVKVDPGLERAAIYRPITYDSGKSGIAVSTPKFEVADANKDDVPDLIVSDRGFGSAGAGDTLDRQEIWSWDKDGLHLTDIKFGGTSSRHLKLYQANFRYNQGQYKEAIELYETVIKGKGVKDVIESVDEIRLFAAFRLAMIGYLQNKNKDAKTWVKWMEQEYPEAPLTQAGRFLVDNAKNKKQLPEVCKQVTALLYSLPEPLGFLGDPFSIGYGNPSILPEDVCYVR